MNWLQLVDVQVKEIISDLANFVIWLEKSLFRGHCIMKV